MRLGTKLCITFGRGDHVCSIVYGGSCTEVKNHVNLFRKGQQIQNPIYALANFFLCDMGISGGCEANMLNRVCEMGHIQPFFFALKQGIYLIVPSNPGYIYYVQLTVFESV